MAFLPRTCSVERPPRKGRYPGARKSSRLLFHTHRTNFARNVAHLDSQKKGHKISQTESTRLFLGWPFPRCGACRRKVAHLSSRSEARSVSSRTLRSICFCFHVKRGHFRPNLLTDMYPALNGATFGPKSVLFLKTTRFTVNCQNVYILTVVSYSLLRNTTSLILF